MKTTVSFKTGQELKKLVDSQRPETVRLLKYLARKKPAGLDKTVHNLHQSFFDSFDCLGCANCCKDLGPRISDADIERLSRFLKMKPSNFTETYLKTDEEGDTIFNSHPCPFLQPDNYCSVYESRPKACREYPHTDRSRFYQILGLTHKNTETCPVAYEIMEELKRVYLQS